MTNRIFSKSKKGYASPKKEKKYVLEGSTDGERYEKNVKHTNTKLTTKKILLINLPKDYFLLA